jgi:hypothetical protein
MNTTKTQFKQANTTSDNAHDEKQQQARLITWSRPTNYRNESHHNMQVIEGDGNYLFF